MFSRSPYETCLVVRCVETCAEMERSACVSLTVLEEKYQHNIVFALAGCQTVKMCAVHFMNAD